MTFTATTTEPATGSVQEPARRGSFHAMTEGTAEDWQAIAVSAVHLGSQLPERVLTHLRLLDGDFGGFAVDRLTHCLQTAHRAERAGRDDQYVLAALLHDIGDTLGPFNHADVAASIVKPFVRQEVHWMVEHHAEFQGYYFFHFLGLDRDCRDRYASRESYDLTAEFCADYDQNSFDPDYPTPALEHYEPLVRELMARPIRSIYVGTD